MKFTNYSVKVDIIEHYGRRKQNVRFRVSCLGKRVDLYAGIVVSKGDWNEKSHRIKQGKIINGTPYNIINSDLLDKEEFIVDYFNSCALRNAIPQLNDLKERYNGKYKLSPERSKNEFYYLFDKFIATTAVTRQWEDNMTEKYKRIRERLYKFNPDLNFFELSEATMNDIMHEFSRTMYNDALEKTLFCFKRFVKWADSKHYPIHDEFFSFNPKLPMAKKDVRYLTPTDLDKIKELPFQEGSSLDITRDLFLFQCHTALRYSDLKKLKKDSIVKNYEGKSNYALKIVTEKDDDKLNFPLSKTAESIYLKYRDNVYEGDVLFPVLSNQKYNEHLKELGEKAELEGEWTDYEYRLNEKIEIKTPKKDLSSHTARRTFVVTAYNAGITIDLITMVTSHSDMRAMLPYLKATPKGAQMAVDAFERATASISKT